MDMGKPGVSRWLPSKIRAAREERGLSQTAFAAELDVSRTAVQNWESGGDFPAISRIARIAEVTGKPEEWFFQPPFVTNILPDVLAGAGLAPESPLRAAQPPAPVSAPPGAVDMHALLAQLVQSQDRLSQAMARMAEGQEELRRGQAEIANAVADLAAQEQGATRVDVRHRRERAG